MAEILCVTGGLPGMLYSSLQLARRLSAAGHDLSYASFPDVREDVQNHGLRFVPLPESGYADFVRGDAQRGPLDRILSIGKRRDRAVACLGTRAFVDLLRTEGPDLLLIDGEMHEHIIAASATGVPLVLLNTFASIWRRPGLPPTHHFVRPGFGWKGTRAGMRFLWANLRLKKRRVAWSQKIRQIGCDRLSILRHLAGEVGFDFARNVDFGQWLVPFTYSCFPFLSLHALEFEFPHVPQHGVEYVGPLVLRERQGPRLSETERAEINAVLNRRRESAGNRKLMYAGFGSFFTADIAWLTRMTGALVGRPDWELIVSLGGAVKPGALGPLPDNVHAFSWVPQTDVIEHADVVITHGGINTIDESVMAGAPLLIYCGMETDMAGNAARVLHHGIGIVGDRRVDGADEVRHHIDRLLAEASFKRNVHRLRSCYVAYEEDRVAERAVEALLSRQP